MQKVQHATDYVLINADSDSLWDLCSVAIIYLSADWKNLLRARANLLPLFSGDHSFYSITYWDNHVVFFDGIDEELEGDQSLRNLLDDGETWAYVETNEDELSKLARPKNKIRTFQLRIYQNRTASFQAWGEHTGEKFHTEPFNIDDLQ